jgi:metallo-beta-lactamase class B
MPLTNKLFKAKGLGNISNAAITQWPLSVPQVIDTSPELQVVVLGHGKIGDKQWLAHTKQLGLSVKDCSVAVIQ